MRMIDQQSDYKYIERNFDNTLTMEQQKKLRVALDDHRRMENDVVLTPRNFTESLIHFATIHPALNNEVLATKVSKALAKQYIVMLYRIASKFLGVGVQKDNPDEEQKAESYDNQAQISREIKPVLESIKKYLEIEDDLKQQRLEWILGFPTLAAKKSSMKIVWGVGTYGDDKAVLSLTDHYYHFKSACCYKKEQNCLLGFLTEMRIRKCNLFFDVATSIVEMCQMKPEIAEYVAKMPSPVLTCTNYVHFIEQGAKDFKGTVLTSRPGTFVWCKQEYIDNFESKISELKAVP